jgi:hypothetical protein
VSDLFQNLGEKFEDMDPDPATQFNADLDPQSGGKVIIQHEKLEKKKKG